MINEIIQGDCLVEMTKIPDGSVDMILCDLPYSKTKNKWDIAIPLIPLWREYERVIVKNGAIVLTSSEPFTSVLVMSKTSLFRYDLIWEKQKGSDPLNANRKPLRNHENILIFCQKQPIYNPQFAIGKPYIRRGNCMVRSKNFNIARAINDRGSEDGKRYPKTVMKFTNEGMNSRNLHPTQKPVALFEYLIKTYTNKGGLVLDNCIGSGTTAIACINTGRNFIGIELEPSYVKIARDRLSRLTPTHAD